MPNTIVDNLQRLVNAKSAIASAITTRGGTVASGDGLEDFASDIAAIPNTYTVGDEGKVVSNGALVAQGSDTVTENNTYDTTLINSLTVNVPSSGGGGASESDVNFRDYDGTIVASYSAAEFASLAALPENPTHDGLTAQGWNWTLADAKTYVAANGKIEIGQMYTTADGKTRLYITLSEGRTSPWLKLYLNANSELDIDWGDGSTHSTFASTSAGYKNEQHVYASVGDYVIAITVMSGSFVLQSSSTSLSTVLTNNNGSSSSPDRAYLNSIKRIEIGSLVTSIGGNAFQYCSSLSSITIPDSVTSIGGNAFQNCSSLLSITIPDSVTSIGGNAFSGCYSLSSITIPDSVTSIEANTLQNCYSLSSIILPDSVTSIEANTFQNCYSLSSITIPDSVTSIGAYVFISCSSLSSITIPDSVTSIGAFAFNGCYSLSSITINKAEGSITGSPWGASTGSPTYTQIIWRRRKERYKSSVTEIASGTTLTGAVDAAAGDLVVATFVIRGNTYTISEGWTLLGISNTVGTYNQRTAMAYKIASSSSESLTVTQDTSARIYINVVSITGASVGSFSGFTTQEEGETITMNKPQGLVIWGVSSSLWGTSSPYSLWGVNPVSDNRTSIQLPNTTQPRCLTVLDQSNDETVSFTYGANGNGGLAAASLTITGIPNFWYLE